MLGDRQAASRHLLRAIDIDPEIVHATESWRNVYLDEGDEAAALREVRKILELAPDDKEARDLLESHNF